jgi:hypothetical protein
LVASSLGVGLVFSLFKPGFSIAQRFFPGGYDFFFFSLVSFALFSGIFCFLSGGWGYWKIDRPGAFGVTGCFLVAQAAVRLSNVLLVDKEDRS